MRVKAVVAYDGTGYSGFQFQTNAPSIQADLERVIEKLTATPTRILAAGRTDAGVHALGQVIAFDPVWRHSLADLQRGMNALLPEQISVPELVEAPPDFHPRFDARRRRYSYSLYRAPVRNPLVERYSLHLYGPLDVERMQRAARSLGGVQDFAAFGSPPQGEKTVREVFAAVWREDGDWLRFTIEANAFLYRMVRMIVGTLLRVGKGALSVAEFVEILQSQDRRRAGPAVAAKGLVLEDVSYAEQKS
ncbi:MAG: tRNA pseudouridine(38-40) synthase TruA [Anaerolineales bacterium]